MGEYAEAMLDGSMCEGCGEYLGGQEFDVALLCARCAEDRRHDGHVVGRLGRFFQDLGDAPAVVKPRVQCPVCQKKVSPLGLEQHRRDRHGP